LLFLLCLSWQPVTPSVPPLTPFFYPSHIIHKVAHSTPHCVGHCLSTRRVPSPRLLVVVAWGPITALSFYSPDAPYYFVCGARFFFFCVSTVPPSLVLLAVPCSVFTFWPPAFIHPQAARPAPCFLGFAVFFPPPPPGSIFPVQVFVLQRWARPSTCGEVAFSAFTAL